MIWPKIGANRVRHGGDCVVAALLQVAQNAHLNGLVVGTGLAAIGIAVLPRDHSRADLALAVFLIEWNFGIVQERKQFGGKPLQALHQPSRVALLPRLRQQSIQPFVQPRPSRGERPRRRFLPTFAQPDRVVDPSLQLFGECRPDPIWLVLVLRPLELAKRVPQALLFPRTDNRVVGAPEVVHQHASELVLEEPLQRGTAPPPVYHVIGDVFRREAPQPVGRAVDPPAGFVGMQYGALQRLGLDLEVSGQADLPQPTPHPGLAAGRELEVEIEHVDDLGQGSSQQVVQPVRQHYDAQPNDRAGQGIGRGRFDGGLAIRAPRAMDRVFGDDWRNVGGDILDHACPRTTTGPNRLVTLGAGREGALFAAVDPRWHRPTLTGRPRLGPSGFGPTLGGRLDVEWGLPRGSRRVGAGRHTSLGLGQLLGQAEKGEDRLVLVLLKNQRRLLGRDLRTEQSLPGCRIRGMRTRCGYGSS